MDHAATSKLSYEFRCPVHGFIEVNDWERSVIDHPVFQRLRRIRQLGWTDYVQKALAHMLPDGVFPAPDDGGIDDYLEWDDWRVLAARGESPAAFDWRCIPRGGVAPQSQMPQFAPSSRLATRAQRQSRCNTGFHHRLLGRLADNQGGEHGRRLRDRHHYRQIWESSESPLVDAQTHLDEARTALGNLLVAEERSEKSWYRTGNPDILVATEDSDEVRPLSDYSPVIKQLKEAPHRQVRLYSLPEKADEGRRVVQEKLRSTS